MGTRRVLMVAAGTALLGCIVFLGRDGAGQEKKELRIPEGFQAKPGTAAEPFSKTGWAKEIVHDKTGIEMVFIPAGTFDMGSPDGEKDRFPNEGPVHRVRITKAFYMGKYEVTRGQFEAFVNDSNYRTDAEKEGWSYALDGQRFHKVNGASFRKVGFPQANDHPAVCVSHNDAVAFCGWLSRQTGSAVTLPTEARWEYACRGGMQTAYQWGVDPDGGKGWCNAGDQAAKRQFPGWVVFIFNWDDGFVFTSPVGSFRANAFGLHDMIGNVWEWCADWRGEGYYEESPANDPPGPVEGARRVLRGGGWNSNPGDCRSAFRGGGTPGTRFFNNGFRVALDLR